MTDLNFPHIIYKDGASFKEWGLHHGKSFKGAIAELAAIRKDLMLKKNPSLKSKLSELAMEQFNCTKLFAPHLAQELEGIAQGAEVDLVDIVILNNYTDFRDIELPEEGCSTIHIHSQNQQVSGQTWDMHQSAKNYLCTIEIPASKEGPKMHVLSLVGCLGLMGVSDTGLFIGVNNINTENARAGLIWPALVRRTLEHPCFNSMRETLVNAPVTSGHNYLISSVGQSEHWEIAPSAKAMVGKTNDSSFGKTFHTNHCLGDELKLIEQKTAQSSTTFNRYSLLEKKIGQCETYEDLINLLGDHDGHPKSICSHFASGAQDPSMTCGGGVYDHLTKRLFFWRGCKVYDDNYEERELTF